MSKQLQLFLVESVHPVCTMNYQQIPVKVNEENQTFEFTVDNQLSFIDFNRNGNTINLLHTEVPQEMEGRGIAAAMVEKTFQYLEANNLKLSPSCSYVRTYLKRHPEWDRLL